MCTKLFPDRIMWICERIVSFDRVISVSTVIKNMEMIFAMPDMICIHWHRHKYFCTTFCRRHENKKSQTVERTIPIYRCTEMRRDRFIRVWTSHKYFASRTEIVGGVGTRGAHILVYLNRQARTHTHMYDFTYSICERCGDASRYEMRWCIRPILIWNWCQYYYHPVNW